jgi:hypothetical protein
MPLKGHVHKINDPMLAFAPLVLGSGQPTDGFKPWSKATVTATFWYQLPAAIGDYLVPFAQPPATTADDGSFSIEIPSAAGFNFKDVSLTVKSGVTVYRSTRVSIDEAKSKKLDFWIFHDKLPASDGVTAGDVSSTIVSSGLPANTSITAGPGGLEFVASQGQVSMQFGIRMVPDLTSDLTALLDIDLQSWHVHVDWPTSWEVSPDAIHNLIKAGLNGAQGSMNTAVLQKMEAILATEDTLALPTAKKLLTEDVSVTFANVTFPNQHTWGIDHVHDETVVITAEPCIGFPRHISAEKPA